MIRNDVDANMFDDDEEHTGLDMDPILTTNPSLSMFTSEAGNKRGAFRDGLMVPMYVLTTRARTHTHLKEQAVMALAAKVSPFRSVATLFSFLCNVGVRVIFGFGVAICVQFKAGITTLPA